MRLPIVQILEDGRYFFPLNSTRRNPNFESMRRRVADGNSWYNGAMINVRKRFTGGLQFQASYTYGKSTDEGAGVTSATVSSRALRVDRSDNNGPSDFDIRHNFVFNYSYELPFGRSSTAPRAQRRRADVIETTA